MQVANGIEMLEISATIMGKANVIYPTLIWDEALVILVDTGYPGQQNWLWKDPFNITLTDYLTYNKIMI
jgi:hypothetical protein